MRRRFGITPQFRRAIGHRNVAHRTQTFKLALAVLCLIVLSVGTAEASGDESQPLRKTFVEMTPAELVKEVPELKHLQAADNQVLLPQILKNAGQTVAVFFENFSNTACTEHVSSVVDTERGIRQMQADNKYNYVAVTKPGKVKERLNEYRTDAKGAPVQVKSGAGAITYGFINQLVHFHPDFQPDSDFRYLGRENLEKQQTYVVAFAQRPKVARETASVNFQGRQGVVYMQGIAWIDPVNYRILRLRTDIERPEVTAGLLKETTEINYSEVAFQGGAKTLWLPRAVTVDGQIDKYVFHNQHRYSDYRLFNVQVDGNNQKP